MQRKDTALQASAWNLLSATAFGIWTMLVMFFYFAQFSRYFGMFWEKLGW